MTLLPDVPGRAPRWAAVVADGELSAGSQANPPSPQFDGDIRIEVRDFDAIFQQCKIQVSNLPQQSKAACGARPSRHRQTVR
jgi:hypothetical protein